jgi:hypothetical protein
MVRIIACDGTVNSPFGTDPKRFTTAVPGSPIPLHLLGDSLTKSIPTANVSSYGIKIR